MPFSRDPGTLFIGTLSPADKSYVLTLLKAARRAGYDLFVEPCAGEFAMSCLAKQAGFEQAEGSDITVFSGALGRYLEGRGLEDMEVRYGDGTIETDAVRLMYNVKRAQLGAGEGNVYGENMARYYREHETEIIDTLRAEMDDLKGRVPSMRYFDMDMFEHLEAVKDNPRAIVAAMLPTYKGGYEKSFIAFTEETTWNEPEYGVFDPVTGVADFMRAAEDAKCLVIAYEETEAGNPVGVPMYGRPAGRAGMNMYLVTNRPEEVEALVGGKRVSRSNASKMCPSKYALMPFDHEITAKSSLMVVEAKPEEVRWYRRLFTHNFTPSGASSGYLMLVDGYIAGLFGYDMLANDFAGVSDHVTLRYGMCTKTKYRLNRLLYRVACKRDVIARYVTDVQMESLSTVRTAIITKHGESKEMRGLMKRVAVEKDKRMGNKLTYECPMHDMTYDEIVREFITKEERWKSARQKS